MKKLNRVQRFFAPEAGSPRWMFVLPYIALGALTLMLLFGGVHAWEYSNSPAFCGTTCHTMPPQNAVYLESPHSNVTCEECHIGRASFVNQLTRKSQGLKEAYYQIFNLYEYPIRARALRPAQDTCEKCHRPETFSDDSLRVIDHFAGDRDNTRTSTYLILKTGGGDEREGLGFGIHWHITNEVLYYSEDELNQEIPFVRVVREDGSSVDYVDVESGFDPAGMDPAGLKRMDCVTCHNRVTHDFMFPADSVDLALSRGLIDPSIPLIRSKAVAALSASYESRAQALGAIAGIEEEYKRNLFEYYSRNGRKIQEAVAAIQAIYDRTVFPEQEVDWTTHPNNLGHVNSPGCFRCHDGAHLNAEAEAVRLECNLCHAIPVVATDDDFITTLEVSRGPEPESHLNPNWISLHNQAFGPSCSNCHSMADPGGTSNTSFCSNSACHGSVYTFAGFDAPALREILRDQLPAPEPLPESPTLTGEPTYANYIGSLFASQCTVCHAQGEAAPEGLDLSSYAAVMQGGRNGPVVRPGDSANSTLMLVQSGDHFSNFDEAELAALRLWIDSGAPQGEP